MKDYIDIPIRIKISRTTQLILEQLDAMDENLKIDLAEDFLNVLDRYYRDNYRTRLEYKDLNDFVRSRALDILDQFNETNDKE